ncbi:MAG TPA: M1 family aminopeptidase [candidate division Zixibacteria bacterium]|nr:M1 family aminopeptidase [candidate division Zixibacteria bacterium]
MHPHKLVAVLATLILMIGVSVAASETPDFVDHSNPTPTELHRLEAYAKSRGWLEGRLIDELNQKSSLVNTQENYDVLKYDIYIDVDDTTQELRGSVGIYARAAQPAVNAIQVDLADNMTVDSIVAPSGSLSFSRSDNMILIDLDNSYNVDDLFHLYIYYQGRPLDATSFIGGFSFDTTYANEPCYSSLSQPYGARSWWPCKDRNDDKADTFTVCIEAQRDFYVASNGRLDSIVTPFGQTQIRKFYYVMPYPMVSYLFSIALYPYYIFEDEWVYNNGADTMPIINAVYPDKRAAAEEMLAVTPGALTIYSDLYGLYPYADLKYGHANFEWTAAMEHQTMTSTWCHQYYDWGFNEATVVHELAHQWFGDMMTCHSWADLWLNEGWASYSEALYFQAQAGANGWSAYHTYMAGMDHTEGGTIYRYDTLDVDNLFDIIVYDKAAWLIHMLRGVLGDSLFFTGLDAYTSSQYRFGSVTTDQFIDLWEQATGVELRTFFEDWLYGEYRPHYLWAFLNEANGDGTYTSYIAIDQMQTTEPQVFHMPVDVVLETEAGMQDTMVFNLDLRRKVFVRQLDDPIVDVHIDPANWVMNYTTEINWKMHFIVENELPVAYTYLDYELLLDTRGGSGDNTFSWIEGSLPNGLVFDPNTAIISGQPTDTGQFTFTVYVDDNLSNYWDEQQFFLHVIEPDLVPGDIDMSGSLDIADLVYMATYMFQGGPEPPVINLTDVNGSCVLDIADLIYLVEYMFQEGPEPVVGCIEP